MSIKERIGTVDYSTDLGEGEVDEIADVDVVRACGVVGASNPLGVALWHLKYSQAGRELPRVVSGLLEKMHAKGWHDCERVVELVLVRWIDDVCPACSGRGYDTVPGTPLLSAVVCWTCEGVGRRRWDLDDPRARWLFDYITTLERETAAAIMRKLAREMEF